MTPHRTLDREWHNKMSISYTHDGDPLGSAQRRVRKHVVTIVLCIFAASAFGETVSRTPGEGKESFATRYAPANSEIIHTVIETSDWNFGLPAVIAFY